MNAVCVVMPTQEGSHPVHRQCLSTVDEFGQLMRTMAQALEDGTITRAERDEIASRGYDALAAIVSLLKSVETHYEEAI